MKIGVLGAMPDEVDAIGAMVRTPLITRFGGRTFTEGTISGREVAVARTGIGKVAAAVGAVELIARFGVSRILVTGVAGALSPALAIGDIVVAEGLIQHDIDASPLFPPMEVPLTGVSRFVTDRAIRDSLAAAAGMFLSESPAPAAGADASRPPRVHMGDIATGDRFIASDGARADLASRVPSALCVEMEGAAVAQVCHQYGVPLGVVRLISDGADRDAPGVFLQSLGTIAAAYATGVVGRWLGAMEG